jgi:ABC-2 type transport system ATP-binding protein
VDGLSFAVPTGKILSLLGPNGAGKSTTISIICGLLIPNAGEVRIFGDRLEKTPFQSGAD